MTTVSVDFWDVKFGETMACLEDEVPPVSARPWPVIFSWPNVVIFFAHFGGPIKIQETISGNKNLGNIFGKEI